MVSTMFYNDKDYITTFNALKDDIFTIKIKGRKFEFSVEDTKMGKAIRIDDTATEKSIQKFFNKIITPDAEYWNLNNCIKSVNLTLETLVSSYSLLKLQVEDINKNHNNPNFYWFAFYYEITINKISTLDDLLFNLVNLSFDLNFNEDINMKKKVNKYLKSHNPTLLEYLKRNEYKTKSIRNDFIHNTKPFYYKDRISIENDMITVGKGERKFNFLEDLQKIDKDIEHLKQKYFLCIPLMNLFFV